ncbi:MAG: hypothetical protein HUU46_16410 [Candidatus Hydrogenedentes bacterium]|nr:hypothetical protein [Candidatus Hydrogenedentota bacterium]
MDLTRVLESPHALHAASVHLPMSLAFLGLPLILVTILTSKRWHRGRTFVGAYFLVAGLIALAATLTGMRAASELVALASSEIETALTQHRLLGYSITVLAFATSVLLAASHFRGDVGRRVLTASAMLTALALAVAVLFAGSSGGRLVYGFGIGTPVARADGTSGATIVVGAYPSVASVSVVPTVAIADKSVDAMYTPKTLAIDPVQAAAVTFQRDIVPLLERRCFKCHSGNEPEAGLDLTTRAGILEGGDYAGAAVIPGAPDQSPMVLHLRGIYEPKMPKDAEELTESELHTIRMWIFAGAKGE